MARRNRMYLAGYPYHIVQCGNNCDVCFLGSENYLPLVDMDETHSGTVSQVAEFNLHAGVAARANERR